MSMSHPAKAVLTCAAGTLLAAAALLQLFATPPAAAQANKQAPSTRNLLTPATFADLHKVIGPTPRDYPWIDLPWFASLWDARQKAAAEDKPILVFGTGGAGYNDPLGNC
jgi:hypothetical protein